MSIYERFFNELAFKEGKIAYNQKIPFELNPYPLTEDDNDNLSFISWNMGWDCAAEEDDYKKVVVHIS